MEETGIRRRKCGKTGTPTLEADAPTGPSRSEILNVRNKRKHRMWRGVLLHRKGSRQIGLALSSHDTNGENYIMMNGVGKAYSCIGLMKVYFFRCYL